MSHVLARTRRICALALLACAAISAAAAAPQAVEIEMVAVSDAGNAPDLTGYGGVAHEFKIAKLEVTISQYAAFLNAVAKNDTYGLYDPAMANPANLNSAGTNRTGAAGNYTYAPFGPAGSAPPGAASAGDRPATYISWVRAARWANWMVSSGASLSLIDRSIGKNSKRRSETHQPTNHSTNCAALFPLLPSSSLVPRPSSLLPLPSSLFPLPNGKANGQPAGAQGPATTEDGAYTLNGATSGFVAGLNALNPNTGEPPLFYIPREDEWCAGGDSRMKSARAVAAPPPTPLSPPAPAQVQGRLLRPEARRRRRRLHHVRDAQRRAAGQPDRRRAEPGQLPRQRRVAEQLGHAQPNHRTRPELPHRRRRLLRVRLRVRHL
jgi:hypothetical protein